MGEYFQKCLLEHDSLPWGLRHVCISLRSHSCPTQPISHEATLLSTHASGNSWQASRFVLAISGKYQNVVNV
jgi:hypothetical protein